MKTNELGQYLKDLRKSYGYTQEFVASKLNIIAQTYSHYETGRNMPPVDIICLLAKLYHIPVEQLLSLTVPASVTENENPGPFYTETAEELNAFIEYMKEPAQSVKYKHLTQKEKRALYYFQQLTLTNQDKILDMLQLEVKHQKK